MRIGIGYDIHRLVEGRKLFLGGVQIPYSKGLIGHSDGDVLLHSASDAILGAAGLPDIGELFPDTDFKYKNMDSRNIFSEAVRICNQAGFTIVSLDIVVICEEPKIIPYKHSIIESIKSLIGGTSHVNVKGKTNERMGDLGSGNAIACISVALLQEI
ncbi:MAG: 2-C-methyl-D-erythritol 2,4-cyclodiphosphate synthase [Actinobacteria bacterium]|nr:2-C-methyl-D-erythritol 2,4-cyclodiphosphate synthase [Actinomycetota bacterium]